MRRGTMRRKSVSHACEWQYDHEDGSPYEMRCPSHPFLEGHAVRPLPVVSRATEESSFLEWSREKGTKRNDGDRQSNILRMKEVVLGQQGSQKL